MAAEKELLPQLRKITAYMAEHADGGEDIESAHSQADALLISACRMLAEGRSAKVQAEVEALTKGYYGMIKWYG